MTGPPHVGECIAHVKHALLTEALKIAAVVAPATEENEKVAFLFLAYDLPYPMHV
jgi:hypothetical protein